MLDGARGIGEDASMTDPRYSGRASGARGTAGAMPRRGEDAARAWRLALLLTGDPEAAEMILLRVLVRDRVPPTKVRQGLVMASRTVEREQVPISAWSSLLRLPGQSREAWVLRRVAGLGPVETARAMDCSRSASERFLERGEAMLGESLGGSVSMGRLAAELRAWSAGEPVPESLGGMVRARLLRSRTSVALRWVLGVLVGLGVVWAVIAAFG